MRCRPVVRPLGVAALALLLGAAAAVPAGAAPAPPAPPAEAPPTGLDAALERDLGVAPAEAPVELAEEAAAARQEQRIAAALGDDFGGAWWDPAAEQLVVGTDDPARAALVRAAGARPEVVEHELDELEGVQAALDAAAGAAGAAVSGWYVDPAANEVVVTTADAAAGHAFVAAAGAAGAAVRVAVVAEEPQPGAGLLGGTGIGSVAGTCSAGFGARDDDGDLYVLTAGHCTRAATDWTGPDGTPLGSVDGSDYPVDDFGSIEVDEPAWTALPQVAGQSLPLLGTSVALIGSSVCHAGVGSGFRCGTVLARNVTVSYDGAIVGGLTKTSACGAPGDSGGPYVVGQLALGLHSGASGACDTDGAVTYYQPVNEALHEYDLTLVSALTP